MAMRDSVVRALDRVDPLSMEGLLAPAMWHLPCAAANIADIEECLMLQIKPTNWSRLLLTALLRLIGPTRPATAASEDDQSHGPSRAGLW
jgi:hypothetical protein